MIYVILYEKTRQMFFLRSQRENICRNDSQDDQLQSFTIRDKYSVGINLSERVFKASLRLIKA